MPPIAVNRFSSAYFRKKLEKIITRDIFLDYPRIFCGLAYEMEGIGLSFHQLATLNEDNIKIFFNRIFLYIENIKQANPIYVAEAFETNRSQEAIYKLEARLFSLFKEVEGKPLHLPTLQKYENKIKRLIKPNSSLVFYRDKIAPLLTRLAEEDANICFFARKKSEKEYLQARNRRLKLFDQLIGLLSIENRIARHVSQIKQYILDFENDWRERKGCEAREQFCAILKNKNQGNLVKTFKIELERLSSYQASWFLISLLEQVNTLFLMEDKTVFEASFKQYQVLIKKLHREAFLNCFLGIISLLFVLPVLLDYQKTKQYFSQAKTGFVFFKLFTKIKFFENTSGLASEVYEAALVNRLMAY